MNGATTLLNDNVEGADDNGWTTYNFRKTVNGDDVRVFDRAYVVENRQYQGYDRGSRRARTTSASPTRPTSRSGSSTTRTRTAS